ncbi:uncharacterized protein E5676_scaffold104G00330 [Cucumis melo var. makuwa]|uniref:Uncharacterized protein n=1 Tax=Cucumis melo var. makuwa TaxID=1194695 RepID=A0A5D3B9R2_CUCMM|nr:uncharacterized protein E5676_scaffold104G00330 [Cucumis melo var. makuwa]
MKFYMRRKDLALAPLYPVMYFYKRGHIFNNCPTLPPCPSTHPPCRPSHSHKPKFSPKVISSNSTTLVVTSSTSWLLDSACCNHMISNISLLASSIHVQSLPPIHSAYGSGSLYGTSDWYRMEGRTII